LHTLFQKSMKPWHLIEGRWVSGLELMNRFCKQHLCVCHSIYCINFEVLRFSTLMMYLAAFLEAIVRSNPRLNETVVPI
jgi:hypothetical protein